MVTTRGTPPIRPITNQAMGINSISHTMTMVAWVMERVMEQVMEHKLTTTRTIRLMHTKPIIMAAQGIMSAECLSATTT